MNSGVAGLSYWMGVQYICLVACKIQPVDGYVSVCQVLTPDTSNLVIRIQGICNICTNQSQLGSPLVGVSDQMSKNCSAYIIVFTILITQQLTTLADTDIHVCVPKSSISVPHISLGPI